MSPLIIMLTMMMMTGGSSGGSSYSFSGKTDDVDVGFLLLKARAAARKIPCPHRRGLSLANAPLGGRPISTA